MKIFLLLLLFSTDVQATDSCFGTKPEYDSDCSKIADESQCQLQHACRWGDPTKNLCFAKDSSDTGMEKFCANITNESTCNVQIGCAWRSPDDAAKWVESVSSAVTALNVNAEPVPTTVSLGTPTMSSSHDHQSINVGELQTTLNAWKVKYGLPDSVVTALSALVVVESEDFKSVSKVLQNGESGIELAAAGGRNYNGRISIAFVYGTSSCSLVKNQLSSSCVGAHCTGMRGRYIAYGKCTVDGSPTSQQCCTGHDVSSFCSANCDVPTNICTTLPSSRALSPTEASAILHTLQSGLFPKVNSEATLLENELRAGLVEVV